MSTSDLLSDLRVDRTRTAAATPRRVPALELRVTPLHWSAPRCTGGPRWSVQLGPVHATLQLG